MQSLLWLIQRRQATRKPPSRLGLDHSICHTHTVLWLSPLYKSINCHNVVLIQRWEKDPLRINGTLPNYLNEHLILNNKRHSRNTRYSSTNAVCPKYKRETEGGRSFAVSATRLWNSTPIEIRKLNSVACFKKNMFAKIFKEQQFLHHFII